MTTDAELFLNLDPIINSQEEFIFWPIGPDSEVVRQTLVTQIDAVQKYFPPVYPSSICESFLDSETNELYLYYSQGGTKPSRELFENYRATFSK